MTKARISSLEPPYEDCVVIGVPLSRPPSFAALTRSELEVAEGILAGLPLRELARTRDVSPRTVAHQVATVYKKLGVSSRYELVALVSQPQQRRATRRGG